MANRVYAPSDEDIQKVMIIWTAFASIFARAEVFAVKNKVIPSVCDGLGMGIGFFLAMIVISFFRELLGKGALWGFPIVPGKPLLIMILPAGGFFAVGILMGFFNWVDAKLAQRRGAAAEAEKQAA